MLFKELIRIKKGAPRSGSLRDRIPQNPHAKSQPRRIRRQKLREQERQARLEARNLGAAANNNIEDRKRRKV